jgi:hypothetical protein
MVEVERHRGVATRARIGQHGDMPFALAMRSTPAVALALALGSVTSAHAGERGGEPAAAARSTLTTNPVRYGLLHFQIEYERAVAGRLSLFVSPIAFHHATWYPFARAPDMTASGLGLDLGGRYFVTGAAPAGAFIGPLLSAYRGRVWRGEERTLEGHVLSPGLQAGYTRLAGRWALSAGAGLSYGLATEEAPAGSPRAAQLPHRGPWLNFRFNLGLAF